MYRLIDIIYTYIHVTYVYRYACMRKYVHTSLAPADSWRPAVCVLCVCVCVCVCVYVCMA